MNIYRELLNTQDFKRDIEEAIYSLTQDKWAWILKNIECSSGNYTLRGCDNVSEKDINFYFDDECHFYCEEEQRANYVSKYTGHSFYTKHWEDPYDKRLNDMLDGKIDMNTCESGISKSFSNVEKALTEVIDYTDNVIAELDEKFAKINRNSMETPSSNYNSSKSQPNKSDIEMIDRFEKQAIYFHEESNRLANTIAEVEKALDELDKKLKGD